MAPGDLSDLPPGLHSSGLGDSDPLGLRGISERGAGWTATTGGGGRPVGWDGFGIFETSSIWKVNVW